MCCNICQLTINGHIKKLSPVNVNQIRILVPWVWCLCKYFEAYFSLINKRSIRVLVLLINLLWIIHNVHQLLQKSKNLSTELQYTGDPYCRHYNFWKIMQMAKWQSYKENKTWYRTWKIIYLALFGIVSVFLAKSNYIG